ncbi:MAG: sulfotransferase family 2 domain-containing protein [Pseudomonadota bacterium]
MTLAVESDRKLNRLINALALEPALAHLPKPARLALARKRYGWIDFLVRLQSERDGDQSLIETEAQNAIFIHIPKTGGISVAEGLFGSHAAAHTALYTYLALYGARRFDAMFKFAIVRNPWDRVVSAYHFMQAGGLTETDRAFSEAHMQGFADINDFVERGLPRPEIRHWTHFKPQMLFLRDPRTGDIGVDALGRFETLAADYDRIAARLGIDRPLPHRNKGRARPRTGPGLSASAIARIDEFYAEDAAALGYTAPA